MIRKGGRSFQSDAGGHYGVLSSNMYCHNKRTPKLPVHRCWVHVFAGHNTQVYVSKLVFRSGCTQC